MPVFIIPVFAESQQLPTDKGILLVDLTIEETPDADQVKLKINFINPQTNAIQEHIDYKVDVTNKDELIFSTVQLTHTSHGSVIIPVELKDGENDIKIDVEGILFKPIPPETVTFTIVSDLTSPSNNKESGCLIATAAYGTELAPQVQNLREIRDNVLFSTGSGTAFMAGFNEFYYTFSPALADLERQSPTLRELVKYTITPMLATLSILNYIEIDSEQEMLGYGIGIILLNIGMYFVAPAIIIIKIKNRFCS
jgi:hypothetical protein